MMIKNWLLPHRRNGYHPYILRPLGLGVILFLITLQPLLYNGASQHTFKVLGYATDISSATLFSLTNQERAQAGIAVLSSNPKLTQAAQTKAQDMFAKNYWAHVSPDGTQPWTFMTNAGYSYSAAGENLAKDFDTSGGVMAGWMGSGEHRANILNPVYKEAGIAVMNGTLLGSTTTLVVAMYGAPTIPAPAVAAAPSSSAPTSQSTPKTSASSPAPNTQAQPTASSPAPAAQTPADKQSANPSSTNNPASQSGLAGSSKSLAKSTGNSLPLLAKMSNLQVLNWGQRATLFLLSTLILINVLKHTIVWRLQKRGLRHIWLRAHPIAQLSILLLAIITTLVGSYGVVL